MTTKIIGGKFISLFKIVVATVLAALSCQVYAEYYVVYSPPVIDYPYPCTTCATPCQHASCYKYKRYKTVAVRKRHISHYNVMTYYVWPMYAGALWVPRCGGGDCTRWVSGYCGTPDCADFYVPPEYFTVYQPPDTLDMGTADP